MPVPWFPKRILISHTLHEGLGEYLAARRPEAWLVFVLRYRTASVLAGFFAANGVRPLVLLC